MRLASALTAVIGTAVAVLTVALTVGMTALVVVAVVMRYVAGAPLTYSYDLSTLVFAWIVFLGLSLAEFDRAHLAVDVIDSALPPALAPALVVVRQVALAGLSLAIALIGWRLFQRAGMVMPSLRISIGWLYASLPIGFALLAAAQLLTIPGRLADLKATAR